MKKQSGFTLIELIIVIVILGILAVTVAPQFFNFGRDARTSTVRALEGSMRSASEMVYARGQISADGSVEVRDGVPVTMNGEYAAATAQGIGAALQIGDDWDSSTVEDDNTYFLRPAGFEQSTPTANLGQDGDGCFAYYTWAGGTTGQPEIGSVTGGC